MTEAGVTDHKDEAPMLAAYSLKPVIEAFASAAGVDVETRDISLAGRILAVFADLLPEDQRVPDTLTELGELATTPEANIIKLPNISASVPQLKAAIAELRALGYELPTYPDSPTTDEEKDARARYDSVKGSAVNPVLREGNSDRRAPAAVKNYAKSHPHRMGAWSADSKTEVAVRLTEDDGGTTVLKKDLAVEGGEVVDATFMSAVALDAFLAGLKADDGLGAIFAGLDELENGAEIR